MTVGSITERPYPRKIYSGKSMKTDIHNHGYSISDFLALTTKMVLEQGLYKNVSFAVPDPLLFTPPGGCRQMPERKSPT